MKKTLLAALCALSALVGANGTPFDMTATAKDTGGYAHSGWKCGVALHSYRTGRYANAPERTCQWLASR